MSDLLDKIRHIDAQAARTMEDADFRTDAEIQSLTPDELQNLFPESKNIKLRRKIFETINKRDPIHELLKEIQGFIPQNDLKAALSNNGVLVRYLHILKDIKTHLNSVQSFIDANITVLEEISSAPSEQEHAHGSTSNASGTRTQTYTKEAGTPPSPESPRMTVSSSRSIVSRQDSWGFRGRSFVGSSHPKKPKVTVKYKMVVSGKTFNAHRQILDLIMGSGEELILLNVEENQVPDDCQVILVFCPVVSRVGTDVEAAMRTVVDKWPVILVLMHHTHEAKYVASMRTWTENPNIVFHVNVFYHEKIPGLVSCKDNTEAVSAIRNELEKYGTKEEPSECSSGSVSSIRSASAANNCTSLKDNQTGILSRFNPANW